MSIHFFLTVKVYTPPSSTTRESGKNAFFYDVNPTGRRLEFDDSLHDKTDFVRYAVEFRCHNP